MLSLIIQSYIAVMYYYTLQLIEEEAHKLLTEGKSSSGEESAQEDEDDKDVPMAEMEDDIPLTKTSYPSVPPAYPPIQVCLCHMLCRSGVVVLYVWVIQFYNDPSLFTLCKIWILK